MTAAERRNIVIDSTNPTVNIRNSSNSQPTVTNNVQTYQIPTPPVSTPTTSPIISNNNTRLTTNNTVSNTANTPPPPPAPSVRNSSVNLPTTPVVSPPTSTPPAAAVSTSILVGRYNPSRIGLTQLPAILTRNIFFIFTPTTIFVTGTCNNYVYPYNIEQRGTTTFISIDVANRLTRTGANCDASDDILYISPFEQSNQITLSSDSVTGRGANVVMSLVDRAGNPTISLNKVIVPNSS